MGKFGMLAVSFVKRQYYPHLLLTLLFVAFSGGFVSFRGLYALQAAKDMEFMTAARLRDEIIKLEMRLESMK